MQLDFKPLVLFYPASIVGYIRIVLLAAALLVPANLQHSLAAPHRELIFATLISLSLLLDLLDGYLARKLNQTSRFGLVLDLLIDLVTHTIVWLATGIPWFLILVGLEWLVGLGSLWVSERAAAHWKKLLLENGPWLVRTYFANNQRNWLSAYGCVGHTLLPLVLYVDLLPMWLAYLAVPGLILYELVTLYMLIVIIRLGRSSNLGN